LLGGSSTFAGRTVDETSAMQISTVWACVRILSETIGSMPWAIYERDDKGNSEQVDHPLASVLMDSPNADMTSVEFRESSVCNLALRGNCYSLRENDSRGEVASLFPIPACNVVPKRKDNGDIVYEVADRGKKEVYPQEKIWHIKGFGSDGLMGFSPISYARQAMGSNLATEEFGARFFSQGAKPSMIASIPNWLSGDQRPIARENLQQMITGQGNAHRVALLEGGMTVTPVTMPLEDAQFLGLRGFGVEEICRFYRMQPHMVASLARSTNNNIEHQGLEFVMYTLQPYLTRFESSVKKWLFKVEDRRRFYLRFNVEGLLRADGAARAALYSTMLQNGVYSRNEVRALENRNRVDGLDDYTVQSNMTIVQLLEQLAIERANPKQGIAP
jgi:HK97 family phage portal protein